MTPALREVGTEPRPPVTRRPAASRHAPRAATSGAGPGEHRARRPAPPRRRRPRGSRAGRRAGRGALGPGRERPPGSRAGHLPRGGQALRLRGRPRALHRLDPADGHRRARRPPGPAPRRRPRRAARGALGRDGRGDAARPPRRRPAGRRGHAGRGLGRQPQLRARRRGERGGDRPRRARAHLDLPVGVGGRRLPARPRWARSGPRRPRRGRPRAGPAPSRDLPRARLRRRAGAPGEGARGRRGDAARGGRHLGRASRRRRLAHDLRPPGPPLHRRAADPEGLRARPRRKRPRTTPCAWAATARRWSSW